MTPPADGSRNNVAVNGRTYVGKVGVNQQVPSFDAPLLEANGWTRVATDVANVGHTAYGQDNQQNLDKGYFDWLSKQSGNYRKRFYEGQYIDEVTGALWTIDLIRLRRDLAGQELGKLRDLVGDMGRGDDVAAADVDAAATRPPTAR